MPEYKTVFISTTSKLLKYLDKKRQDKKTVETFEIVATFITITCFLVFAIKPAIITIIGLVGEIDAKQKATLTLRTKINQIVMAQDIFSKVQERYSIIESALPERPRYAALALQYQGVGQSVGVDTNNLSFGFSKDDKKSEQKQIVVTIGQSTSFLTGLEFINQLKNNRRLIQINSVSYGYSETTNNATASGKLTLSVSTNGLYWPK